MSKLCDNKKMQPKNLSLSIFDWGKNSAKKGERLESGKAKGKKEGANQPNRKLNGKVDSAEVRELNGLPKLGKRLRNETEPDFESEVIVVFESEVRTTERVCLAAWIPFPCGGTNLSPIRLS